MIEVNNLEAVYALDPKPIYIEATGTGGWRCCLPGEPLPMAFLVDRAKAFKQREAAEFASAKIAALFGKPAGSVDLVYAEINANARASRLIDKKHSGPLGQAEAAELAALDARLGTIEAIRAAQDQHKTNIDGLSIVEAVETYPLSAGWP
jgi:hypothetical protein